MSTSTPSSPVTFSPFLPVALLALSILVFMGWQTTEAVRQRGNLIRLADRQELLAAQAAQSEAQLQSLMMDLLELARTDDDARAIASKYNIKFNPPPSMPAAPQSTGDDDALLRASKPAVTAPPAAVQGPAPAPGTFVAEP